MFSLIFKRIDIRGHYSKDTDHDICGHTKKRIFLCVIANFWIFYNILHLHIFGVYRACIWLVLYEPNFGYGLKCEFDNDNSLNKPIFPLM